MDPFMKLVLQMRIAQKEYFKTRSVAALSKSKGLERAVDHEISKFQNPDLFK